MAIAWKIVADKLGWPLQLRNAPQHLYLSWNDGQYQANLEATDSAKPVTDEEYRTKEGISEADYEAGLYMRDMSPRQMLAAFISCRAQYWDAIGQPKKAFEDLLLAVDLDPVTPSYKGNLVRYWRGVRKSLDREFAQVVGEEAIIAYERRERQKAAHERAMAMAQQQIEMAHQRSGIPDQKRIVNSVMPTPRGPEYNPTLNLGR